VELEWTLVHWYDSRVTDPNTPCPDRTALGKAVEDTAALVSEAKKAYEEVRKSRSATQGELLRVVEALNNARNRAWRARHAFDAHVAVHRCLA
jgi:hypothetical protein